MAYCRMGEDSDLYIYNCIFNGYTCMNCKIPENRKIHIKNGVEYSYGEWSSKNLNELLNHLNEHIKLGHKVPSHTIERIEREIEKSK